MRFILAILLIFLANPCAESAEVVVIGQPTMNYSNIILWAGFETGDANLESSNCNSGTDTAWTLNSSAAVNAAAALSGTYGLDTPGADDNAQLTVTGGDYFDAEKGAIAFMARFTDFYATGHILGIENGTSNNWFYLIMHGAGEIRAIWLPAGTPEITINTTSAGISDGATIYIIVVMWDSTANTMSVQVYDTSCTLQGSAGTSTAAMTAMADLASSTLTVGDPWSSTQDVHFDKLVIFNGSIILTAEKYCEVVKEKATCPK